MSDAVFSTLTTASLHLKSACLFLTLFTNEDGDGNIARGEIVQVNDYYPFRLKHSISTYPNNASQKYLYNGKELQDGTDLYYYGFRMYDPALGRFPSLDPKADEFSWVSPYNYAENRPIDGIDLWGLQYVDYQTGQALGPLTDAAAADIGAVLLPGFMNEAQYAYQQQAMQHNQLMDYLSTNGLDIPYSNPGTISSANSFEEFLSTGQALYPVSYGGNGFGLGLARDPVFQMSSQMLLGGGITSWGSALTGKFAIGTFTGAMDLVQQGVSKQDFSLSSFDFANAGFKGLSAGLLSGNSSSILNSNILGLRSVSNIGVDFLSSTIDLKYTQGVGLNMDYKFNTTGAIEFGYRSLLGVGFDKLNLSTSYGSFGGGVTNKYLRTKLIIETLGD